VESKARFLGHSIHQTLVVFPLGLLLSSVVFDILASVTHRTNGFHVAYWLVSAGVVSGLVAAVFGLMDLTKIPGHTRARRVGMFHAVGNALVLFMFGVGWFMRATNPWDPPLGGLLASYFGALLLLFTAWAGGELVSRLGMGVYDDANLDAPTSWSLFKRDKTPTVKL
jgi:uncharacterized membrane protein